MMGVNHLFFISWTVTSGFLQKVVVCSKWISSFFWVSSSKTHVFSQTHGLTHNVEHVA
jgi:hypothetical protein